MEHGTADDKELQNCLQGCIQRSEIGNTFGNGCHHSLYLSEYFMSITCKQTKLTSNKYGFCSKSGYHSFLNSVIRLMSSLLKTTIGRLSLSSYSRASLFSGYDSNVRQSSGKNLAIIILPITSGREKFDGLMLNRFTNAFIIQ